MVDAFRQRAEGRCFRCLARDHRIADCRDPFKCLRCFGVGHRARHCHSVSPPLTSATSSATAHPASPPSTTLLPHRLALHDRGKPGLASNRADRVEAVAEYSTNMLGAENDLHARGIIAIKICEDPSRDAVGEAFGRWLGVPRRDVEVDLYPNKGFLVLPPSPSVRDHALSANTGFTVGQAKLLLLPWTRFAGAEAIKLPFKVRLCIEGVPHHARRPSTIRQLLPQDALFECIDYNPRNGNEAHCCCVTVWSRNPDNITKEVTLCLEELPGCPAEAWHFADISDGRRPRAGPVQLLAYDATIHIGQVVDFRPATASSAVWPVRHSFQWRLGFSDGWTRPPARRSVHERLGRNKRIRSPSGDGGADGDRNTGGVARLAVASRPARWQQAGTVNGFRHNAGPLQVWARKAAPMGAAPSTLADKALSG
jgi:hypothetical protein